MALQLRGTSDGAGSHRLRAILIAPDVALSDGLLAVLARRPEILVEVATRLECYPESAGVAELVGPLHPDILIVDVASDREAAFRLIRALATAYPDLHSVAIHHCNDQGTLMQALRMGATEFLHAPFAAAEVHAAITHIGALRCGSDDAPRRGTVVGFTSAKPGSGTSTLAQQAALFLRETTGERVLLADFDLWAGLLGSVCKVRRGSLLDALRGDSNLDGTGWSSLTYFVNRIEILQAPESPPAGPIDLGRLGPLLDSARRIYDWVVLDLPPVFHPLALAALTSSDRSFLISTTELPSLHLARRAVDLLEGYEFLRNRWEILLNRHSSKALLSEAAVADILSHRVSDSLPHDFFALHKLQRLERLPAGSSLGAAIQRLAGRLSLGWHEEAQLLPVGAPALASVA